MLEFEVVCQKLLSALAKECIPNEALIMHSLRKIELEVEVLLRKGDSLSNNDLYLIQQYVCDNANHFSHVVQECTHFCKR